MDATNKALVQALLGNHLTALELIESKSFEACLVKAQVLLSLGKRTEAISVLDTTPQETAYQKYYVFQVLAKAFLQNSEPKSAVVCLSEASKIFADAQKEMTEQEIKDCEANHKVVEAQAEIQRNSLTSIGDVKDFAFLKSSKSEEKQNGEVPKPKPAVVPHIVSKYDWFQNATHVFVTFKVVGDPNLAQNTTVTISEQQVSLKFNDQTIVVPLSQPIDKDASESKPFAQKLELKLKKKTENVNWVGLEPGQGGVVSTATPVPVQPTSKPKPYASNKNWDAIDKDLKEELENEKPEGDAALNSLFKQIYERADPDTRRAMMKSYQTSGGTVLSTNWNEVAEKDYEGKDRPSAPDGQEWADEREKKTKGIN